jgi:hypothetical protein
VSTEPAALRNRLVIATSIWREATDDPLPKLPPGDPAAQIEEFEIRVVDLLCGEATPESAKRIADQTWDLVQDRPDSDPVRQRVVECHERLAKLSAGGGS